MNRYRIYNDKTSGIQRKIKYVRAVGYFVDWHFDFPPSQAELWELEDGSIVQIPVAAWDWAFGGGNEMCEVVE